MKATSGSEAGASDLLASEIDESSRAYRLTAWLVCLLSIGTVAILMKFGPAMTMPPFRILASWVVVIVVIEQFPVVSKFGLRLDVDFPILVGAAFVFGPVIGAVVAFATNVEPLEWKGQIPAARALFNRSVRALSVAVAGCVFAYWGGPGKSWPIELVVAVVAVVADVAVNYALVALLVSLRSETPFMAAVGQLRLGPFPGFLAAYISFGVLALPLAVLHAQVGVWALATFLIPIVIARQAFSRAQALEDTKVELAVRGDVIREVSERIALERRDERLRIASSLHDDVLQSLHFLTLHAQVIREDLRHGRLLQLEEDVPTLLEVSRKTADLTRGVIQDLRDSPLGRDGVGATVIQLVAESRDRFDGGIECAVDSVGGDRVLQTLIYQVAREALENSVRHSGAHRILVSLREDNQAIRLVVEDDGSGFVVADRPNHFGLPMMRERVAAAGGSLRIWSGRGQGTRVEAAFPVPSDQEERNPLA